MKNVRRLLALGAIGMMGVAGCELAVDFDRTKIDSGTFDASISETSTTDAPVGMDAQGDGTVGDSATDAANDADAATAADAPITDSSDSAVPFDADDGSDAADE